MSVLVKGMEMPVFEHQSWDIRKGADGKWYMVDTNAETSDGEWHEIVPVPAHGRLGDMDAIARKIRRFGDYVEFTKDEIAGWFENGDFETIIQAEEGE